MIFAQLVPGESKKVSMLERLVLPEYITDDVWQYLIK